jgi:hypothetical protein
LTRSSAKSARERKQAIKQWENKRWKWNDVYVCRSTRTFSCFSLSFVLVLC